MTRAAFRQVDVTRALRAAKAAGVEIMRFEITSDGKIIVESAVPSVITTGQRMSAYDQWKADRNGKAK
jgi:hypothetical protein